MRASTLFVVVTLAVIAPAIARADDGPAPPAPEAAAAPAAAPPAPEPLAPPPPPAYDPAPAALSLADLVGPLVKTFVMLGVVLALVYLSLHKGLGKLVEKQNAGKRIKVVERSALDSKRSIFLVDIDGKQMVLAAGEGGITKLADVAPQGSAPDKPLGAKFADALKNVSGKSDAPPITTVTKEEVAS